MMKRNGFILTNDNENYTKVAFFKQTHYSKNLATCFTFGLNKAFVDLCR